MPVVGRADGAVYPLNARWLPILAARLGRHARHVDRSHRAPNPARATTLRSGLRPPGSDALVEAHRPYLMHAIEAFGPDRCMFESNFPVDKLSVAYAVVWNAFKKLVVDFSEAEKESLFRGTARRVYGMLPL